MRIEAVNGVALNIIGLRRIAAGSPSGLVRQLSMLARPLWLAIGLLLTSAGPTNLSQMLPKRDPAVQARSARPDIASDEPGELSSHGGLLSRRRESRSRHGEEQTGRPEMRDGPLQWARDVQTSPVDAGEVQGDLALDDFAWLLGCVSILAAASVGVVLFGVVQNARRMEREKPAVERRKEPRRRTRYRDGILYDSRGVMLAWCSIKDRSDHGARVKVMGALQVGANVQLLDSEERMLHMARVIWSNEDQAGLRLERLCPVRPSVVSREIIRASSRAVRFANSSEPNTPRGQRAAITRQGREDNPRSRSSGEFVEEAKPDSPFTQSKP